jgi:16S rRNA (uracil1498-N3)-methyltransferase
MRRAAAAHVFVDDLDDLTLDDDDAHHLRRALRLRSGEVVTASDGVGSWRVTRFDGSALVADGDVLVEPRPAPALLVGFALVKGSKPELVVQKLTELGIDQIVPFVAARSVVRWDDAKATSQLDRLRRVAREAAMQSRRVWCPVVEALTTFAEVVARPGTVLADPAGGVFTDGCTGVLVGPEGGWDEAERAAGAAISLGDGVLRAETAAIAAGTLLAAHRAGLVVPAPPGT